MIKLLFARDALKYGIRAGEAVWFDIERAVKIIGQGLAEAVEGAELLPKPKAGKPGKGATTPAPVAKPEGSGADATGEPPPDDPTGAPGAGAGVGDEPTANPSGDDDTKGK